MLGIVCVALYVLECLPVMIQESLFSSNSAAELKQGHAMPEVNTSVKGSRGRESRESWERGQAGQAVGGPLGGVGVIDGRPLSHHL